MVAAVFGVCFVVVSSIYAGGIRCGIPYWNIAVIFCRRRGRLLTLAELEKDKVWYSRSESRIQYCCF